MSGEQRTSGEVIASIALQSGVLKFAKLMHDVSLDLCVAISAYRKYAHSLRTSPKPSRSSW